MNVIQNSRNKFSGVRFDDFSKVIVAGGRQPQGSCSVSSDLPPAFTPHFSVPGSVVGTPAFRRSTSSSSAETSGEIPAPPRTFFNLDPLPNPFGPPSRAVPFSASTSANGSANVPSEVVFKTPSSVNLRRTNVRLRQSKSSSEANSPNSGPSFSTPSFGGFKYPNLNNLRSRSLSTTTPGSSARSVTTPNTSSLTPATPRTTSSSNIDTSPTRVIIAITAGRGHRRYEVGMAAMDINRPALVLTQISDTPTYSGTLAKIAMFDPCEIVIPHTIAEGQQSQQLFELIRKDVGNVVLSSAHRRLYSDSQGLHQLTSLCLSEYEFCQELYKDKYFALAASNALLRYVEVARLVMFASKSLKVEYQGAEHSTFIGRKTAEDLELISNGDDGSKKNSLLSVLGKCLTGPGSRLLRANILQPPCSQDKIKERLDCVEELISDDHLLENIRKTLHTLPDVSQLLTLCMQLPPNADHNVESESRFNRVLTLKTTLQMIPAVAATLTNTRSPWLVNAKKILDDRRIAEMHKQITDVLNDEARIVKGSKNLMFQRSFAVKNGIDELIDVTRQYYTQKIVEMQEYIEGLANKHDIPIKLQCNATRGYHIQMQIPKKFRNTSFQLPAEFLQVQRSRSLISCTTEFICIHNDRLKSLAHDLIDLSDKILKPLVEELRKHMGCLYRLSEVVAELDMIVGLAVVSRSPSFTRPHFDKRLAVVDSRHPILNIISSSELIPNDIFASEDFNLMILTGPNMSGKSIYLRQVLLLQIMAQVGCYVPARKATFRIADRIFSRLRFEDQIDKEAGALVAELREISLMFKTFSSRSIVALDETCHGTSVDEGVPIAWALCESLIQTKAFVFFATHLHQLTKLANVYPCITNMSFEVLETPLQLGGKQLQYTHRLVPGPTTVKNYGLRFAEISDLPASVLEEARELCDDDTPIYEVSLQRSDVLLSREKLMLKAKGVLERLYYTDQLRVETAKQVKEYFWSAVENLPTEIDEMAEDPEQRAGALNLQSLLHDYLSPVHEFDKGYDSEDVPMDDSEDVSMVDDVEVPDKISEFSFQSDTTVRLMNHSQLMDSDSDDMEEDDEEQVDDDDEDESQISEQIKRHEEMYQSHPWTQSRQSFDGSPLVEVTPRPAWGLLADPMRNWLSSAGLPQHSASPGFFSGQDTTSAYVQLPGGDQTPAFQRMFRNAYKSPDDE